MDATLERLMALLKKDAVSAEEAREGVIYCFCVVNRAYMKNGAMEIGEDTSNGLIDKMMRLLAQEVGSSLGINLRNPRVDELKRLKTALDKKLEFATKDSVISQKHEEVIKKLFELAEARVKK